MAPFIVFDEDSGLLGSLFPSESLATGLLAPDEILVFQFECDVLGVIFSDEAEQILSDEEVAVAVASERLHKEDDFDCGDLISYVFIGEGVDFGVVTSVNGRVVD